MAYWKTVSERIVHETPWAQFRAHGFQLPNGKEGMYTFARTHNAVNVIPLSEGGEVLLQYQYRYLFELWNWEVVSGGMQSGEDPALAAMRELKEEIDAVDATLTPLGEIRPNSGLVDETGFVYLATNLKFGPPREVEELEPIVNRCSVPLRDIPAWIAAGGTGDGTTISALILAFGHVYGKNVSTLTSAEQQKIIYTLPIS